MDRSVEAAALAASHGDLTLLSLFLQADIVVKAVMLILILASVWCWAIIFEKALALRLLQRRADAFEDTFWASRSLDALLASLGSQPGDPLSAVFMAGMREWRAGVERGLDGAALALRLDRAMTVTAARELSRTERGLLVLASVGSSAPFIGLFGTVWGIMNSFAAIAGAQSTNLAVVAPGIAEALFATALGLVAAIPAVLGYNVYATAVARYADRLETFSGELAAILTRGFDRTG